MIKLSINISLLFLNMMNYLNTFGHLNIFNKMFLDTSLMENYHKLSKGSEKLKEYKKNIIHHKEILSQLHSQLQYRKKQLLQELLFIYPIKQIDDNKYTIYGIFFPNSDKLAGNDKILKRGFL